jgi:hypothetical protein
VRRAVRADRESADRTSADRTGADRTGADSTVSPRRGTMDDTSITAGGAIDDSRSPRRSSACFGRKTHDWGQKHAAEARNRPQFALLAPKGPTSAGAVPTGPHLAGRGLTALICNRGGGECLSGPLAGAALAGLETRLPGTKGGLENEMTVQGALDGLGPFVGEWKMTSGFVADPADAPRALTTFEWLSGRRFLVQRWQVDHPEAPDGIAIIGLGHAKAAYLQHYFDSRGVARVYEMTFADGLWTLERHAPAPDFSQRFTGNFSHDASTIAGRWERSSDASSWAHDFDLTYTRVR